MKTSNIHKDDIRKKKCEHPHIDPMNGLNGDCFCNYCGELIHKGVKPSKKTEWERKSELVAMNIVYQMGDELKLDVDTRQKTNDLFIDFAQKLILNLLHQKDNEIRKWAENSKTYNRKEDDLSRLYVFGEASAYNQALDDLLTYLSDRNE